MTEETEALLALFALGLCFTAILWHITNLSKFLLSREGHHDDAEEDDNENWRRGDWGRKDKPPKPDPPSAEGPPDNTERIIDELIDSTSRQPTEIK